MTTPATHLLGPASGPAADSCLGTRWGDFELVGVLGRGGMGTVYEAVDCLLNRRVALKLLTSAAGEPEQAESLFKEARVVAQLDHPNIVSIYQVGRAGDRWFIAMQLVRGRSAAARVREMGPMPPEEALRVVREAARGLAAVHALGVIHRDVKPDNILLGEGGEVKVADFGLARPQASGTLGPGNTGLVMGTPHYMSPEQAQGHRLDARSDVYSLGATWFCLLTGRPPFPSGSVFEVLSQQVYDEPPPLASLRPDLPAWQARLITRMLAKRPADRPADAAEVVTRIERPEPVPEATEVMEPVLPAPRRRGWLTAVGVIALFVAVDVAATCALSTSGIRLFGESFHPFPEPAAPEPARVRLDPVVPLPRGPEATGRRPERGPVRLPRTEDGEGSRPPVPPVTRPLPIPPTPREPEPEPPGHGLPWKTPPGREPDDDAGPGGRFPPPPKHGPPPRGKR